MFYLSKIVSEIKIVSKMVKITPKGEEMLNRYWGIYQNIKALCPEPHFKKMVQYWDGFQEDGFEDKGGPLLNAVSSLSIITDEQIIRIGEKIPLEIFNDKLKHIMGYDKGIEESFIKICFTEGLLA